MDKSIKIKIMGTRGSFFSHVKEKEIYGQETSCVYVRMGSTHIVLDFGSGITRLTDDLLKASFCNESCDEKNMPSVSLSKIHGLLAHPHADHMIGLLGWTKLHEADFEFDIYSTPKNGYTCKEQLEQLFHPVLWPVALCEYPAKVTYNDVGCSFYIEDVYIETFEVSHPGGSTMYKLTYDGKTIVYACDIEYSKSCGESFDEFVSNSDLMIFDSYFTDQNYIEGWGHSTYQEGIDITKRLSIGRTVLTHHHYRATDNEIGELDDKLTISSSNCCFAKDMMEIEL